MWLLVVLCTSVACESDLVGIHRDHTYERCVELGEALYADSKLAWMCVKDVSMTDPGYEEFE